MFDYEDEIEYGARARAAAGGRAGRPGGFTVNRGGPNIRSSIARMQRARPVRPPRPRPPLRPRMRPPMGGGYIEEEWVQAPPEELVDVGELVASEMFQGDPLVDDEDFGFEDDFDFSAELPAPQTHKQRRLWRKLGRGDIEVDEYLEAFTTFGAARPMPPVRHPSPQEASLLQEISALEGRIAHLRARLNQRRAPLTSKQKARLSVLSDRLAALRTRIERYGACGYGYCSQEAREVMGGVDEVEHEAFGVYVDMPPFTHPVWVDDEPCKAPAARPSTALVTGASTGAGLVIGITAAVFIMGALAKGFSGK